MKDIGLLSWPLSTLYRLRLERSLLSIELWLGRSFVLVERFFWRFKYRLFRASFYVLFYRYEVTGGNFLDLQLPSSIEPRLIVQISLLAFGTEDNRVWGFSDRTFGYVVHVCLESTVKRVVLRSIRWWVSVSALTRFKNVTVTNNRFALLASTSVVELVAGSVDRCGRHEVLHEGTRV